MTAESQEKQTQTKPMSKIKADGQVGVTATQITSDGELLLLFLEVCLAGPKHINEMRIKAPPEKNSTIRRLGSLQRVSHPGITGSTGCWFGPFVRTLRAAANCSAVARG